MDWLLLIAMVIALVVIGIAISRSARIVPEGRCLVVLRMGALHTVHMGARQVILIPFIDMGIPVDLAPQELSALLPGLGQAVALTARVTDPAQSVLAVPDWRRALEEEAVRLTGDLYGTLPAAALEARLCAELNEAAREWGVEVVVVKVK